MKRIVVFRFSAMGDVAMTVPVIYSLAKQYPELEITVVSRKAFQSFFEKLPANVHFFSADLQGNHKGICGLFRLFRELRKNRYDGAADLHDVLRTRFLRLGFRCTGIPVARIHKGRKEKRLLTRTVRKRFVPLKTSVERYREVFSRLGFHFPLTFTSLYEKTPDSALSLTAITGIKGEQQWVGVAPFAKHSGKIYPLTLMEQVVNELNATPGIRIFLFGGGKQEAAILTNWEKKYPQTIALPGKLKTAEELLLMSQLDVMVSMDSANMHMASLVHTPVISIWGATHPWCGFMGYQQDPANIVQTDLPCRPCSVFGNKPCYRKDYACLQQIQPAAIIRQIFRVLKEK